MFGFMMAIVGGYAWFSKDNSAAVRNAQMTKTILDQVNESVKRSDELGNRLTEATVSFALEIGKTNEALKEVAISSKNVTVNLPNTIQFNVVYRKPIESSPVVVPVKKPATRSRVNN